MKDETTTVENTTSIITTKRTNNTCTPHFYDPRPDLNENYGDSVLWTMLLELAHNADPNLYGALLGFRCQGTTLKKNVRWGHILTPAIDPKGDIAWRSQKEYDEEKRKWLDPYRKEIIALLKKF